MCDSNNEVGVARPSHPKEETGSSSSVKSDIALSGIGTLSVEEIMARADTVRVEYLKEILAGPPSVERYTQFLSTLPGWDRSAVGFIGYGNIPKGAKVIIAVYNTQDREIVESIAKELRSRGAKAVDTLTIDEGEDHLLGEGEEVRVIMRRGESWWHNPRRWDYDLRVYNYAVENQYDVVIHGRGSPFPRSSPDGRIKYTFRAEAIPWQTKEQYLGKATIFPPKLHALINAKTWNLIYKKGRGRRVRVTDPEGTDLEFTLFEKYFDRKPPARNFRPNPQLCHLHSHPAPPILPEADTNGVVEGTTAHFGKPFPKISVQVDSGAVKEVKGGGKYGEAWRMLLKETVDVRYPGYPRNGLFWLWEMAIGTNVKISRPSDVLWARSGSFEWERRRSGVVHCGFGTSWQQDAELWAIEKGYLYGHLHVHLLFPTYEIKAEGGDTIKVIEDGHLTALDDPEVKELAKKYGNPDELLKEDWIPKIPGVNAPGSYDQYSADPTSWIAGFT